MQRGKAGLHYQRYVTYEKTKLDGDLSKAYFTSYLRADFVERALVVTLHKNRKIKALFFSAYRYGTVEWINGEGLVEPRLWESDEQAVSPSYLTRRYTVRMADGPATEASAVENIIPDVLDNMENTGLADTIRKIVRRKKSSVKIVL